VNHQTKRCKFVLQRTSSTNHLHGSRACKASRVISVLIQRSTWLLSWFYAYALKQHALLKKNQQILALSCIVNSQIHVCTCIHETHKWNTILDLQNLNDFIVSTVKNKFTQNKYNYATSVPLMNVRALIINTCKLNQICGSTSSSQFSKMRHQNPHGNVHIESFITPCPITTAFKACIYTEYVCKVGVMWPPG